MKEGLLGGTLDVSPRSELEEARLQVARWAGSESEEKIDVCLLSPAREIVDEWASPPDADGLRGLATRVGMWGAVRGVIESMNGARFVRDGDMSTARHHHPRALTRHRHRPLTNRPPS
jgi:hypothetical protein